TGVPIGASDPSAPIEYCRATAPIKSTTYAKRPVGSSATEGGSNPAGTRGCDIADIVPSGAMLNCRRKFCTPFAPLPETPDADPPDGCIVIETIGPVPSTVGVGSGASEPSAATENCEMRVLPMAPTYANRALGCRATSHGFFPAATSPAASGESEPSAATENC